MKKIILLVSLLTLSMSVFSQIRAERNTLVDEDFERVSAEIKKKVKNFQRDIGKLAGNDYTHNEKLDIRKRTLVQFMGEGERYELANPTRYGYDTIWHNAVVMGSAPSKYNKNLRKYVPMKTYLSQLISNSENPNYRYKKVIIEGADVVTLDKFKEVGDGRYICTAHFLQKFTGYYSADMVRDVYQDYTAKTITIFVNRLDVPQHDGRTEHYWLIKLGDVDCDDVW